jgi:hypothetical protein
MQGLHTSTARSESSTLATIADAALHAVLSAP